MPVLNINYNCLIFLCILAPPSPLVSTSDGLPEHAVSHGLIHHTLPHMQVRVSQAALSQHRSGGAQSPPLPPPPPPEEHEHEAFGRPRTSGVMPIVPDEEDLPGWVPKNYIEKGM